MLAKELKTKNWVFGIEKKIVNTTTYNVSHFVKAFNVYGETAETVENESSNKERSSCSGGNVDEDTIQPVQLLLILGRNNVRKVLYSCQSMCVVNHTLLILWLLLMLARLQTNVLFTKSVIVRRLQRPERYGRNSLKAARHRIS